MSQEKAVKIVFVITLSYVH